MNVLLVGFFGEGNLGDEAILEGIRTCLPSGFSLIVTSGKQSASSEVKTIRRRGISSWFDFIHALKQCQSVVFSGGILQDWSYEGVTFFALRMIAASCLRKKPSIWGAGLGPLRKSSTKALAALSLRKLRNVWLRDHDSVKSFGEISSRKARLGADWSWAIKPESDIQNHQSYEIGLNLRPWFVPTWTEITGRHFPDLVRTGNTLGISARNEDERLLKTQFPDIKVFAPADFSSLMENCSSFREGWAMRYHVLLAMLRADIPVVPLPYDEKVLSLCREAGVDVPEFRKEDFIARRPKPGFFPALNARFTEMKTAFTEFLSDNLG